MGSLGATASSELSGLMRWASTDRSGVGVAVVMDEADAFLGDRRYESRRTTPLRHRAGHREGNASSHLLQSRLQVVRSMAY